VLNREAEKTTINIKKMKRAVYFLLLTMLFGCGQQSNQVNKTEQILNKDKMIEANKNLVRLWLLEGWNKNKNEEVVAQVFSEDWVTTSTALDKQPKGTEGAMYWVHEFRKVFSDVHFEITHLVADSEFVSARFICTCRHTGTFLGIPATDKKIKYNGIVIHQVTNGHISKTWTEFDLFGIKTQLEAK
jgi:steroid delta-isomerase-like uncharacterized protein